MNWLTILFYSGIMLMCASPWLGIIVGIVSGANELFMAVTVFGLFFGGAAMFKKACVG